MTSIVRTSAVKACRLQLGRLSESRGALRRPRPARRGKGCVWLLAVKLCAWWETAAGCASKKAKQNRRASGCKELAKPRRAELQIDGLHALPCGVFYAVYALTVALQQCNHSSAKK